METITYSSERINKPKAAISSCVSVVLKDLCVCSVSFKAALLLRSSCLSRKPQGLVVGRRGG